MRIFLTAFITFLILISPTSEAGKTGTWSGPTTHQFFPTIIKALLGNGFALVPAQALVGDCSDGNVTISAGTTTLTRDMFYNNLTISGTGILSTQNQRVYVCGTLDITAAPAGAITGKGTNGGNASGATGGTAGAATGAGTNVASRVGGAGATATTAAGTSGGVGNGGNALAGSATTGSGGTSGAGGAGTNAGGAARPRVVVTSWPMRDILTWYLPLTGSAGAVFSAGSGPGGGAGGGDGANTGGGGGGGGASGSSVFISANILKTSGSTPTGVITVDGGSGGNGGNSSAGNTGGGGGGGGGSGGWAVIKWNVRSGATVASAISAAGGAGGTGGTKTGTGVNGSAGNSTAAQPGLIQTLDYATGLITSTLTGSASL